MSSLESGGRDGSNPFNMTAGGGHLAMKVAPDNGEEVNGTEILTYEATVTPAK